jgi:hypothetical protein
MANEATDVGAGRRVTFRLTQERFDKLVELAKLRGWYYGRALRPNISEAINSLIDSVDIKKEQRNGRRDRKNI